MDDRGFYKDSIWNGSAKEGREIFDDLLKEASIKLSETLETDAALKYQDEAKTSAEKLMEGLVKAANPNVPDIEVVIDFR